MKDAYRAAFHHAVPRSSLIPEVVGPECSLPVGVGVCVWGGGGRLQVALAICKGGGGHLHDKLHDKLHIHIYYNLIIITQS